MKKEKTQKYKLSLYVAGMSRISARAIDNIKKICDDHLKGSYGLEVIDIYSYPLLVKGAQIIVAPTLIKKMPLPLKRFIGDMSDTQKILIGLDVTQPSDSHDKKKNSK